MINILGICGSPVKDSNTKLILKEAKIAIKISGFEGYMVYSCDPYLWLLRCRRHSKRTKTIKRIHQNVADGQAGLSMLVLCNRKAFLGLLATELFIRLKRKITV